MTRFVIDNNNTRPVYTLLYRRTQFLFQKTMANPSFTKYICFNGIHKTGLPSVEQLDSTKFVLFLTINVFYLFIIFVFKSLNRE